MDDKQNLLIALSLGLKEDHSIRKDLPENAGADIIDISNIDKDDFFNGFEKDGEPKNFFHYKEAWEKLPDYVAAYAAKGVKITPEDITEVKRPGGKTLLEMAVDCGSVIYAFVPEIWAGRREDMENTWYSINKSSRASISFSDILARTAEIEGVQTREAQLKEMGISHDEMIDALKKGPLDTVLKKLEEAGDYLRVDDLLLMDADGDTVFFASDVWNADKFEKIVDALAVNGEVLDRDFFMFQRGTRGTILTNGLGKTNGIDQIFSPKVWAGRPNEMLELFSEVPESNKSKFEIHHVLLKVLEETYAPLLEEGADVSLEDLTETVSVLEGPDKVEGEPVKHYPVSLLGLESVWKNIEQIEDKLAVKGEALTSEHLAIESGYPKETVLMIAIKSGEFEKALDVLKSDGGLSAEILLQKSERGKTALDFIVEKDQVALLLDESMWVGMVDDFMQVYQALPDIKKAEVQEQVTSMHSHLNILSLRKAFTDNGGLQTGVIASQAPQMKWAP